MPPHVLLCQADGRTIGLDLVRGRYFARNGVVAGMPVLTAAALDLPAADRPTDLRYRPDVALAAIVIARIAVRVLSFRSLMRIVAHVSAGSSSAVPDEQRLAALVREFRTVRRYLPLSKRCLPDSIAMLLFLWLRRSPAELVIGVTGMPFSAHCWVQTDRHVLSDVAGTVRRRAPILSSRCLAGI